MSQDLMQDLNEYFCEKFEGFDLISALPSYESVTISMALKNRNRIEEGKIATNEVRKICFQPNKEQVLAELKERNVDADFTFSVRVASFRARFKARFGIHPHGEFITKIIQKYGKEPSAMPESLGIKEEVWKGILRDIYVPEKVLLFKLGLHLGMRREDFNTLLKVFGAYYDPTNVRDVVVRFLIDYQVFNAEMIGEAFDEFRLRRIV